MAAYHGQSFADAAAYLDRGKSKLYRPVANNTYLVRESVDADEIQLVLHSTAVVTYKRDGTAILAPGGWDTPTTRSRIAGYSPARVYSEKGSLVVAHADDPRTPARVQKCRTCHGRGRERHVRTHETRYVPRADGGYGHHRWILLPYPVQTGSECWRCKGAGRADY